MVSLIDLYTPAPADLYFASKGVIAELLKVGPKGYIHGWIFVGAPGVGSRVFHPHHGEGTVRRSGKRTVTVEFAGGKRHAFEHAARHEGAHPRAGRVAEGGHFAERLDRRTQAGRDAARAREAVKPTETALHGPVLGRRTPEEYISATNINTPADAIHNDVQVKRAERDLRQAPDAASQQAAALHYRDTVRGAVEHWADKQAAKAVNGLSQDERNAALRDPETLRRVEEYHAAARAAALSHHRASLPHTKAEGEAAGRNTKRLEDARSKAFDAVRDAASKYYRGRPGSAGVGRADNPQALVRMLPDAASEDHVRRWVKATTVPADRHEDPEINRLRAESTSALAEARVHDLLGQAALERLDPQRRHIPHWYQDKATPEQREALRVAAAATSAARDRHAADAKAAAAADETAASAVHAAENEYFRANSADMGAATQRMRDAYQAAGGGADPIAARKEAEKAERKALGIKSQAALKQLPPNERNAAEMSITRAGMVAEARTALANNQKQRQIIEAEIARGGHRPATRDELAKRLDLARSYTRDHHVRSAEQDHALAREHWAEVTGKRGTEAARALERAPKPPEAGRSVLADTAGMSDMQRRMLASIANDPERHNEVAARFREMNAAKEAQRAEAAARVAPIKARPMPKRDEPIDDQLAKIKEIAQTVEGVREFDPARNPYVNRGPHGFDAAIYVGDTTEESIRGTGRRGSERVLNYDPNRGWSTSNGMPLSDGLVPYYIAEWNSRDQYHRNPLDMVPAAKERQKLVEGS